MMEAIKCNDHLLDNLEVGITITTWHPEAPPKSEWVFVNQARCRFTGHTKEELFMNPPIQKLTRETLAQFDKINAVLNEHGQFTCESTLRHKSHRAIPVMLHMKLIRHEGKTVLFTEQHDISSFKEAESLLILSRESAREMLTLIDKEKQKISENVRSNLGLVLYPLIDQMRITATDSQKDVLDIMVKRIRHIAREIGVVDQIDSYEMNLTRRQILICEMIRDGMTSKEIARALDCSPSTVNNHRNTIRRKLKLSGSTTNLQAFLNSPVGGGSSGA